MSRIFAGTCPIPIVTSPIASTADAAACGRVNFLPTPVTSGHRLLLAVETGSQVTLVQIGPADQVDAGVQACFPQAQAEQTGQVEVAEQANFQQTGAPATGEDGADPTQFKATVEGRSAGAVPGRRALSAIEALKAWEGGLVVAEVGSAAAAAEAAGEAVEAGEDSPRSMHEGVRRCDTHHSSQN